MYFLASQLSFVGSFSGFLCTAGLERSKSNSRYRILIFILIRMADLPSSAPRFLGASVVSKSACESPSCLMLVLPEHRAVLKHVLHHWDAKLTSSSLTRQSAMTSCWLRALRLRKCLSPRAIEHWKPRQVERRAWHPAKFVDGQKQRPTSRLYLLKWAASKQTS